MAGEQLFYNRPTFPAQLNMAHPLTRGLVGCWVLNEDAPNSLRAWDSSPYSNHGLVTGALGRWQGRIFDGTDDDISAGDVAPLQFEYTDPFSVIIWAKPFANNANYTLLAKMAGATTYRGYLAYLQSNAKLRFQLLNNNVGGVGITVDSTNAVVTTNWQMFGFSYTGSGVASGVLLYYDGAVTADTDVVDALAGNTILNSVAFRIGMRESSDIDFAGIIANALVYNRVLTAVGFRELYLDPYGMFLR